jgi:hypothetical protein
MMLLMCGREPHGSCINTNHSVIHEDTPVMMNVHVLMGTIPSHISAMEESFWIDNDNIPTRLFSREKTEVQVYNERSIAIGAS